METTPQIDFQGAEATGDRREKILKQIERLEAFFGRATACRVVVKAPGGHHKTGGLYEVKVHVALPDSREVTVDRTPHQDERFQDFDFALNDAFGRARRQLQDQVRHMRGEVKRHEGGAETGVVRRLIREEGYGFLESADGREIYFHRNSVQDGNFDDLELGAFVSFVEEQGRDGPQASRLTPVRRSAS